MSLKRKIRNAMDMSAMTLAVARNTGRIPLGHKGIVLIEPTSVCNLACPLCPTGTGTLERESKFISVELFARIVELTAPFAEGYVLNLFGEPMFHPEIETLLRMVKERPVWLSTNLNYPEGLAGKLAQWENVHAICSVDTLDPEQYPSYRVNGVWSTVMRNLDILSGGRGSVHPQFLVEPDEFREVDFLRFADEHAIPRDNIIIKTKMENFRLDPTDKHRPGVCHSAYVDLYFDCDGYLLPCCNNVRKDLRMGHANDFGTLDEMLNNAKAVSTRRKLAQDKNLFPSCGDCNGRDFWRLQFPEYVRAVKHGVFGRRGGDRRPQRMDF